jgi:regulator of sigma E protease
MFTFIIVLLIFGLLVLVHEAGHFFTAKRNGVLAEEFGFGFPPRIVGTYKDKKGKRRWVWGSKQIEEEVKEREETIYSINLIPLGGFVKIQGEDGQGKDDPQSFASKSVWTRFKILSAGVAMNVVLAILLLWIAFMLGSPKVLQEDTGYELKVDKVLSSSPAAEAGLQSDDQITAVTPQAGENSGKEIRITAPGHIQEILGNHKGETVLFEVLRSGERQELEVAVRSEAPEGQGLTGIEIKNLYQRYGPLESLGLAFKTTGLVGWKILEFLGDLLARTFGERPVQPAVKDVAGPVGIIYVINYFTQGLLDSVKEGQVVEIMQSLAVLFQFTALLSVNLAIVNFLPLPALDGGRVVFLGIEKIKGKPVDEKIEGLVHLTGFVLLLGLMVLIAYNDFINFSIIDKIKGLFS